MTATNNDEVNGGVPPPGNRGKTATRWSQHSLNQISELIRDQEKRTENRIERLEKLFSKQIRRIDDRLCNVERLVWSSLAVSLIIGGIIGYTAVLARDLLVTVIPALLGE